MIKNIIKISAVAIFTATLLYGISAFATLEPDLTKWHELGRWMYSFIVIGVVMVYVGVNIINEE